MKFLVQCMFLYLLAVVTCIESIRNVESNQRNVHRTHMFSKLHKGDVKLSAKEEMLQQKKSIHSIESNNYKQESTVYINNNNIFKWEEEYPKQKSLNNLRKRHFSFVNIPFQRTIQGNTYDDKNVIGDLTKEFITKNTWEGGSQDRNRNVRHVIKREAEALNQPPPGPPPASLPLPDSPLDSLQPNTSSRGKNDDAGVPDAVPNSSSALPANPQLDGIAHNTLLDEQLDSQIDASQSKNLHSDSGGNATNVTPFVPNFPDSDVNNKINKTFLKPPVMLPKAPIDVNKIPTSTLSTITINGNKTLHHSTTSKPSILTTQSNGGAESETTSPKTPSKEPIQVATIHQQYTTTTDRTLPIKRPTTENDVNVEELQERTSETECKDGRCSVSNVPGSRFTDGTWAMGSMTFILVLLTLCVLYTGLWKKRNQFIYGFKNKEDGAASQQFQKTTVSDVLRRFNLTKKKEMIRLKRMFGGKYNRVALAEGSDIEEEDSV